MEAHSSQAWPQPRETEPDNPHSPAQYTAPAVHLLTATLHCQAAPGPGAMQGPEDTACTGGCSGEATLWDLQSHQTRTVARHEAPIRHLQFLPQLGLLVTGSWDRSLRFWDARTPQPALAVQLPERVYALHAAGSTLVVGTAGRHVQVSRPRLTAQHT